MPLPPYAHVPRESWPNWIWYAIEFGIVLAASMLVSREITNSVEELAPDVQNYLFMGIVGLIFLAWYVGIRGLVLRKKILRNTY
ncbi:MAG: hypothetical protein J4F28_07505 [Nitrosopumilaceae archaeon]|nr:hypothetical protein [Nitrosopumilaceae archaeon]